MTAVMNDSQTRARRTPGLSFQTDYNSDSPRKRTRYLPGGSGRGGRHIDFKDPRQLDSLSRSRQDAGRISPPISRSASARPRRLNSPNKPRYDSAAEAAAAATGQVDGYKPREERSWEEFHPDLDIDFGITIFGADEVDGKVTSLPVEGPPPDKGVSPAQFNGGHISDGARSQRRASPLTPRRRPGRPPRRGESMLSGLGPPPTPKIVPLPSHNPRERLNLPKPSYRQIETFATYEADRTNQVNYVDKTMAHVGFQESEMYFRPDKKLVRLMEAPGEDESGDIGIALEADKAQKLEQPAPSVTRVEYDMDEQDERWLEAHNMHRKDEQVDAIKPAIFEITVTQIEKEWHALERRIPKPNPKPPQTHRPRSSSAAAVNGEPGVAGEEQDTKCNICDDGDCENTNAIVFCDGCDLAVHQECYGVPFIPEGQWLCRKCQMVGKSLPACLFCPNTEGAFKLTHEQRWAHLLCSIWIPEVTLGNPTFMEPIMDVAKVPKSRWKLTCYICNQKMGACIQCGHKFCFLAFHVTCARRAKLYLKMKSTHGGPFSLDASVLKALCDKHVPADWAREHDVPRATALAKEHYRRTMKGRRWADSQASALALLPSLNTPIVETHEEAAARGESQAQPAAAVAAQKKKRMQTQKNVWRLPSGAPIVPQVVFDAVDTSLQRFTVRRRKEFVAEACKYWTLKREARRGAALLKRLQLQLETFSSSDITRRNFAAMGAIGRPRLSRRIDLADEVLHQLVAIRKVCEQMKDREELKLQDALLMRDVVDIVYFPLMLLLDPVLRKAQGLDSKRVFTAGFTDIRHKLFSRHYRSTAEFAEDLGQVFRSVTGLEQVKDILEAHKHLANSMPRDENLSHEQREDKKLAKRIVKAVQQPLYDAFGREAELNGRTFEEGIAGLDSVSGESSVQQMSNGMTTNDIGVQKDESAIAPSHQVNGFTPPADIAHAVRHSSEQHALPVSDHLDVTQTVEHEHPAPNGTDAASTIMNGMNHTNITHRSPPTPPAAAHILAAPSTYGGIPWYLKHFEPRGTEIQDEKWLGRDVLRGMSEQLSEIDDDELKGMEPAAAASSNAAELVSEDGSEQEAEKKPAKKTPAKKKKRPRRFH